MRIYFFGINADPFTSAQMSIIEQIVHEAATNRIVVAIRNLKNADYRYPFELRKQIVEENLKEHIATSQVIIMEQDEEASKFLVDHRMEKDVIIMGSDEWLNLIDDESEEAKKFLRHIFKIRTRKDDISSSKADKLIKAGASFKKMDGIISEITYNILVGEKNEVRKS